MNERKEFTLKFEDNIEISRESDGVFRVDASDKTAMWETDKEVAFLSYSGYGDGNLSVVKGKLQISVT